MRKLVLASCALTLAACATPKTLQATGGSRSDGIVNLSYEYDIFEKPVIDWGSAGSTATARCKAWGYTNAEPFGGAQSQCQQFDGGDCLRFFVTIPYQCTGGQ